MVLLTSSIYVIILLEVGFELPIYKNKGGISRLMKVMVVDGGGRGHVLAWKLATSPRVTEVVCAPGNAGTAFEEKCRNVPIAVTDICGLACFAEEERIDLTVVGPETSLVAGIVDQWKYGRIWGPNAKNAYLEGSKIHAKEVMLRLGIPTAPFVAFNNANDAMDWIAAQSERPLVVKVDGLAGGKGVSVCDTLSQVREAVSRAMVDRLLGPAGDRILIEERLFGREVSLITLCVGGKVLLLPPAKDYKPVGEGDTGQNTGGMGCYSPVPDLSETVTTQMIDAVITPLVEATGYMGTLYAGLMLTDSGPQVLEFNVRFGDPESQVQLPLLEDDLADLLFEAAAGNCSLYRLRRSVDSAVSVAMVTDGYPGDCPKGKVIRGLDQTTGKAPRLTVFHGATERRDNIIVTAGGRVLYVTAVAPTIPEARAQAYSGVNLVSWEGMRYRRDIAQNV